MRLSIAVAFALVALASTYAPAQTGSGGTALRDLNAEIAKFQNAGHKGWTCRDADGKRMHRLDPTNIARMGTVRSSAEGFLDNKTPVSVLQPCTLPR